MSTDITTTSTSTSLVKRAGLIALFAVLALLMGAKFSGALISGPASSGHSSSAADYYTPLSGPGAPTNVSVASAKDATGAATGDIVVSWNNPNSTGVAITSYTVVDVNTGAIFCTAAASGAAGDTSKCQYTPGFAYAGAIKVYANGGGLSTPSDASVTLSVPSYPASATVTLNGGTITWTPPAASNSLSILGYTVYANGTSVCTTTALTCAPAGLVVGQTYTFTVAARNAAGAGATETAATAANVTAITYAAAPAAPTNVAAAVNYTTGKVLLTWAASASTGTGGGSVTYSVQSPTGAALTCDAVAGTTTSCNVPFSALVTANGAALPYNAAFTVTATNLQSLTASGTSNVVTINPVLKPATSVVVATSGSTMTVASWSAPTQTADGVAIGSGANVITGYSLQLMTASAATPAATVTFTPVGSPVFLPASASSYATGFTMTSGSIYTVAVTAVNASGSSIPAYGAVGGIYYAYTGAAAGAPASVTLSAISNSSLTATWKAPTTTNGIALTGYAVELVINGDAASAASLATVQAVSSSTLTYSFSGLTAGASYAVAVSAVNSAGTGSATTSSATILNTAPTGLTLTYTATGVTISWDAPAANIALTSFVVRNSSNATTLCTVAATASSCSIDTATFAAATANGNAIHVYSVDANGVPSAVDGGSVVTAKPSSPANTVAYSSTAGGIYVKWGAATGATSYNIVGNSSLGSNLSATTTSTNYTFPASALAAGATYTFQVNAVNASGASVYASAASVSAYTAPSAPGVPTAVGASQGTAMTWTWTYDATAAAPAATSFLGTLTPTTGPAQSCTVAAGATGSFSCTFAGLTIGMSYSFTVQTIAPLGNSAATSSAAAVVAAGVAGPVTGLTTTLSTTIPGTSVVVKWTPSTVYATAVTGYTVTVTDATGATASNTGCTGVAASAATCTITGLTAGTAYTVSVKSTAVLLGSVPSASTATTSTITTAALPSAVAKPTAVVAGDNKVTITWVAPASNGNAIDSYRITASTAGFGATPSCVTPSAETVTYTDSTHIVLTGTDVSVTCTLTGGAAASTYTVEAHNTVGYSTSNVASASLTPITHPSGTVTAVYAGSATKGYTIGWTDTTTGTSVATSYTVTVLGGASPIVLTGITTTNTTVPASSLQAGLTYSFSVTAVNAQGSATAVSASAGAVPGAPTGLKLYNLGAASTSQTQATLSWTPDATPNGLPITYNVYGTSAAGIVSLLGSTTSTSLTFGAIYGQYTSSAYTVTPVNAAGAGTSVTSPTVYSYLGVPAKPTVLTATPVTLNPLTPTATGETLSWTPDATAGQTAIGYTVAVTGPSGPVTCTVSVANASCVILMGSLVNGGTYTYTVTETTPFGTSLAAAGSFAVAAAAPSAPTVTGAVVGTNGTSVTVNWTAPTSTNGSPLTGYLVTATNTVGTALTYTCASILTSASTSCTISGLAAGGTYTVSVEALNVSGASTAGTYVITGKAYAFLTPAAAAAPAAVTGVTIAYSTVGSLIVSWTPGTAVNASPVTSYVAQTADVNGVVDGLGSCTATAPATTCTITGLDNAATYVVVTAINAYAPTGTDSAPAAATAYSKPATAGVIQAVVSGLQGTLTVVWTAPTVTAGTAGAAPLTGYNVTAVDASGNSFACAAVAGTATTCTIVGLANATTYTVTVTPVNAVGVGTVSATSTGKTLAQTTSPAPVISGVVSTATGLQVTWTAPTVPAGAGQLVGYWVTATDALSGQSTSCSGYNATYGVLLAPAVTCSINGLVKNDVYKVSVTPISQGASSGPIMGAAATQNVTFTAVTPEPVMATFLAVTAKQKSVSALSANAKTALGNLVSNMNDGASVTVSGYGTTKAIALARANAAASYLFNNGAAIHITIKSVISKTVKTALVTVTSN